MDFKTAFLIYATSGLRRSELFGLREEDIDYKKRMLVSKSRSSTKTTWMTFYNKEVGKYLDKLGHLPEYYPYTYSRHFSKASKGRITPKVLRDWFCNKMARLGVQDRYIDAFCGRVPRSILARHYTDFSPERLKEVYDKADLKVLSENKTAPSAPTY